MIDSLTIRDGSVIIDHNKGWSEFKKWINGQYATLRYVWGNFGNGYMDSIYEDAGIISYQDERSFYKVVALDGNVLRTVVVPMVKPKSEDQIDFETNFKSDILPVREEFDNGELFESKLVGNLYYCNSGTTSHELVLDASIYIEGIYYWTSNSNVGDKISLSVINTETGATIHQFLSEVPVMPANYGQSYFEINRHFIEEGFSLKIEYINEGDTQVNLGVTYRWLQSIR
jgi:hypothetical protein